MKTVADVMSTDVVTVSGDQDVVLASAVMKLRRIRHLPVVEGNRLIGMLSHRDLLKAQARYLEEVQRGSSHVRIKAREVMTEDVHVVAPETPAADVAMMLVDEQIGCVPVVREGSLVGIATEADFLRWAVVALRERE